VALTDETETSDGLLDYHQDNDMRKETVAVLEELCHKEKLSNLDRKLLIGACTSNK